ncbi:Arylphorin subunit C223 [Lucilia cuprina]|nr:Arylphorin subunit C223 [Lucilia cuprina]
MSCLLSKGKYDFPWTSGNPLRFPDRLVLPHGWVKGSALNSSSMSSPNCSAYEQFLLRLLLLLWYWLLWCPLCDEMPFGYPFDREIDEYEFFVPNMYFKDVKIYHKETFDKYFEHKYEKFGHFDYNYIH